MNKLVLLFLYTLIFVSVSSANHLNVDLNTSSQRLTKQDLLDLYKKDGITEFKYISCDKIHSFNNKKIFLPKQKIAKEFIDLIYYASSDETKNIQANASFFNIYKNNKNISLLASQATVIIRENDFACYKNIYYDITKFFEDINLDKEDKYYLEDEDKYLRTTKIFKNYRKELKNLLDKESFFIYRLLYSDETIPKEEFIDTKLIFAPNAHKYVKFKLLDLLILNKDFKTIDKYKELLLNGYDLNAFRYVLNSNNNFNSFKNVSSLGFDILNERFINENIEMLLDLNDKKFGDNFELFIKTFNKLTKNLKPEDKYKYMTASVARPKLFKNIFQAKECKVLTNRQISKLVLNSAISNEIESARHIFDTCKFEEYENLTEESTGLNSIAMLKKTHRRGYERNKEFVELLEENGYTSYDLIYLKNTIRNLFSPLLKFIHSILMFILLLIFH